MTKIKLLLKKKILKTKDPGHENPQNPIVLVDSCSFTYYRVCATFAWINASKQTETLSESQIQEKLVDQYHKCLAKFIKTSGVKMSDMYLIRDCPRDQIWRNAHWPTYKANRKDKSQPSKFGPYIKYLNGQMADKYKQVLRVHQAEADDVIAVLVELFSTVWPNRLIYVVATDSDYNQLLKWPNVRIYSPKGGWTRVVDNDPIGNLQKKIATGDSSDNIPSARGDPAGLRRNRQLIDFAYIPRYIQNRVVEQFFNDGDGEFKKSILPFHYRPKKLQLGLCCLNTQLRKQNIFCSRGLILKTIEEKGLDEVRARCLKNCYDLIKMIQWNADNGINVFRISSGLFPHKGNPRAPDYSLDFASSILAQAGELARKYKQRVTFHPGQFNIVGSPSETVFKNTCLELDYHAEVLDLMGCDQDSVMVVHGGGTYGDKDQTIQRWISNFQRLSDRVKRRIVIENCEKSYSVADCLQISQATGVPVVFDTHHYTCYQQLHPNEDIAGHPPEQYLSAIIETWKKRNIKPKFHVSQQCYGGKVGKHSDFITQIPDYLVKLSQTCDIDVMIEAKMKEQAIFQLYRNQPFLDPRNLGVKKNLIVKKKLLLKKTSN